MRAAVLGILFFTSACGLGRTNVLGSSKTKDAGPVALRDSGPGRVDGGVADAGTPDSGVDLTLGEVLSCQLDQEAAVTAAVRFTACTDFPATVSTIVEAWEGFVLGSEEVFASQLSQIPVGCAIWQCAALAPDCQDLFDCVEFTGTPTRRCREGQTLCIDDVLNVCVGDLFVPHRDCSDLDASCEEFGCERRGCPLGPATCSDDGRVVGCDGEVSLDCDAWRPGSRCAPFYVGGEVPVVWCAPNGEGRAGAYNEPVECDGRTIRFLSATDELYEFDCVANGYIGCDERGCL